MSLAAGLDGGHRPADVDYAKLADEHGGHPPTPELADRLGPVHRGADDSARTEAMENLDDAQLTAYGQASSNVGLPGGHLRPLLCTPADRRPPVRRGPVAGGGGRSSG